jgi:hypothetical protein
MAGVEKRSFDSPDESRTPDKTRADVVNVGGTTAARCQLRHLGVAQSGTMRITHDDGTEVEIGPGDTYVIEPGHHAAVVGDEPFVGFEFQSQTAEEYARA